MFALANQQQSSCGAENSTAGSRLCLHLCRQSCSTRAQYSCDCLAAAEKASCCYNKQLLACNVYKLRPATRLWSCIVCGCVMLHLLPAILYNQACRQAQAGWAFTVVVLKQQYTRFDSNCLRQVPACQLPSSLPVWLPLHNPGHHPQLHQPAAC